MNAEMKQIKLESVFKDAYIDRYRRLGYEVTNQTELEENGKKYTVIQFSRDRDNPTYARLAELGFSNLPICMAKNQYSLSDDPKKLGRPEGFDITIREIYVNAGAGFLVALTGDIMTMPGLPKKPAAEGIDVDENGVISGLF